MCRFCFFLRENKIESSEEKVIEESIGSIKRRFDLDAMYNKFENNTRIIEDRQKNFHAIYIHSEEAEFIYFTYTGESIVDNTPSEVGWKLHIRINDADIQAEENFKNGWNIVKDILIDEKINQAKVVKKGSHFANNQRHDEEKDQDYIKRTRQRGKQITIYCQNQLMTKEWQQLIIKITQSLTDAQIKPAPLSPGDKAISGSNYVSYRNDDDGTGRYSTSDNYNVAGHPDPLEWKPVFNTLASLFRPM